MFGIKWSDVPIKGDPLIFGSQIAIILTALGVIVGVTYFKKWKYLWNEWFTSVDHKRIGIMYILVGIIMFARGGIDGIMMKAQTAVPNNTFLDSQHYNEVFTTHGTIMILFAAMPFLIGIMNVVIPLQIGARDVAFPQLNLLSFWFTFIGALLFNLSFVIGGSPDAGWTEYFPLAGKEFTPGIGNNFYFVAVQIAGIGTLATGINFITTIIKMRAPGMTWMKVPMFTWTSFVSCILIWGTFPIFAVALALGTMDRLFGAHFFTVSAGGNPMMWANLFWLWGHPEVYIVLLPAFGMFSEIISTFSRKVLYGYKSMIISIVGITFLSMIVWVHHFFTMGAGPAVNSIFSLTTMMIGIPTGVKMFNWLFTMRQGRIRFTTPMLWSLAFIPLFLIGGITGVMLAMGAADYQYHNSLFLVAHFHYTLIPGVVFAIFAGLIYWWPKMFGHMLNEKIGKVSFWATIIGFNLTFMPMFFLGLDGAVRRAYTYSASTGFGPLMMVSAVGAFILFAGILVFVYNIYWSARYADRNIGSDPWDARTLEWATASPVQYYNFAKTPVVKSLDAFWYMKKNKEGLELNENELEEIHMPSNSGLPLITATIMGIAGFFLIFEAKTAALVCGVGLLLCLIARSFQYNDGYHIHTDEIKKIETAWRKTDKGVKNHVG